jgi:hypothetical protein
MAQSLPEWLKKRKELKERRAREAETVPPSLEDIENLKREGRPDFQDAGIEPTPDEELPPWFLELLRKAGVVESGGVPREPVEERPRIKVPFGFEVRQIVYNQSGDAESILVSKKEKVGKILVLAAVVGFVLGALTLLTFYSLPSSLPFKFPWW